MYFTIFVFNIIIRIYQWCGFKSRRGKNKNLTALKSNSNTVWFNFQTYSLTSSALDHSTTSTPYIYYSKIDNSVSSPQLGYHYFFVNIFLYVIAFGYVCLLNCLYIFFLFVHWLMIDHCLVFISIKILLTITYILLTLLQSTPPSDFGLVQSSAIFGFCN